MIFLKIYNDDKIRKWNDFPTLKDPMVLENTLLRIINELFTVLGLPTENEFNIYNPKFYNLYFSYFTSSNFNSWGELPLGYIYNDIVRLIQNQNSTNNFTMTLESIEISRGSIDKMYDCLMYLDSSDMIGEFVSAYILENYMVSYGYIKSHNNSVLAIRIPYDKYKTIIYIISVGFNAYNNAGWLSTSTDACPYSRYRSLQSLSRIKFNRYYLSDEEIGRVLYESSEGKAKANIDYCKNIVSGYELSNLKKRSVYDTEIKYGNYPIDYNWLNIYDCCAPATMFIYESNGSRSLINKFNQFADSRFDYRLLKKENELIKIDEKKKG